MASEIEAYIRQAAQRRGVNPDIAVRVAMSEGGLNDPFRQGESMLSYGREQSYGPFQLHMRGGGVGERALKAGIDPRKDWKRGVDYALDEGAAKAGIGSRTGLEKARAVGVSSPNAADFAGNFKPGSYVPELPPIFGSMSPGGQSPSGMNGPGGPPSGAGEWAFGEDGKKGRLSKLGAGIDAAMSEVQPPSIAKMPAPSPDAGTALLKLLKNPDALAQALMSRRV
jgi:hypothetical protein